MHWPRGQKVKDQGHTVTKKRHGRTVPNDHVPYFTYQYAAVQPAAVAGMVLHVDTTAYVF